MKLGSGSSLVYAGLVVFFVLALWQHPVFAASTSTGTESIASTSAENLVNTIIGGVTNPPLVNLTQPENDASQADIQTLFASRPITELTIFNGFGYAVRYAIGLGIPANTIVLILLAPVIAMLVVFTRTIIGLPSLDMLVPTALAYAFVAVGIGSGLIILGSVVIATFVSRTLLRHTPIMTLSKRAITHLILALFVFAALTVSIAFGFVTVKDISIFPVLVLMLLGDSIVAVQLRKTVHETTIISSVTIILAVIGYFLATSLQVRNMLLVWPELVLLVIPVDFLIGRYFGLRLTEIFRFQSLESYGSE